MTWHDAQPANHCTRYVALWPGEERVEREGMLDGEIRVEVSSSSSSEQERVKVLFGWVRREVRMEKISK